MIFCLFVLDLLGFEWDRVVRWGRGEMMWDWGVFVVGFGVGVWVGNS